MHTNVLADDATEERIPAPRRWVQPPPKLLTHLSDERLVARVRAGDDRAFEALYDRHHRPLLAFCRHLLGSAEEAEDALQHTFIAAHRALRTDERPVALRAWLFTIARNRCLSVLRSRRNVVALTEVEPTLPVTLGLATQVEQRADLQALVRDLHALSDDQRAALVLSELGDLDHEQIANVLNVKRARVATLVFQARASLMETRKARESACSDIQEQLATLRGGALRRSTLRRHVDSCSACQAFRAEVRRQRAAMALILPVIPSLGLKRSVLSAISSGGGAAGAAAAAGGVSGGIAILGSGGAAVGGGGAVASSAVVASSAAVAGTAAAGGTAVAVGGVSAGVAVGGAAVAAGGAAVAAKALGAKVLLAAAIASGGPGLQAAAEGLGVAEKVQRAPSEAAVPLPTGGAPYVTPAPAPAKGGDSSKTAATGHSGGATSNATTGSGAATGAGGSGSETAAETGSGAGALPEEVVNDDDDGSGMPPSGGVPGSGTDPQPPVETTPTEPPPAETTPAADPPPAETTPAEPAPVQTAPVDPPPAETTPTETTPAQTTPEQTPPEDPGAGDGAGEPAEEPPVATGASVGEPELDPDEVVASIPTDPPAAP
jgi:RNA polymerase sigma factor (sigma-70 family)